MTNSAESQRSRHNYKETMGRDSSKISVLAGIDPVLKEKDLLKNMALLMSRAYALPPFSEAGRSSTGQKLSIDDIKTRFGTGNLTNDVVLNQLRAGHYKDIAPYYPIDETERTLYSKITMPGAFPIVATSTSETEATKLQAFAAAYLCRTTGSERGIGTATELMIRTPYGATYRQELRNFAEQIQANPSVYDPKNPTLCLDEFVVDPDAQGRGLGKRVSLALTLRLLQEGMVDQINPLNRQGLFITSMATGSKMGGAVQSAMERGVPMELCRLERDGLTAVFSPRVTEIFLPDVSKVTRKLHIK